MDRPPRRSKIEKVRLDTLRVPAAGKAQRGFHQVKGDWIADRFHIDSFGVPAVCRVDGVNWLIDGQHRVYGIQKSGYAKPSDEIECEVYRDLAQGEMAHMFLERNHTTPVSAFERFGVALTAGYPAETAVAAIVTGAGLRIGHPTGSGNVFSVGSLLRIHDRYGPAVLELVLSILRDAYGPISQAFGRRFLEGVALVLVTYPRLDRELLVKALASEPNGLYGLVQRAERYRHDLGRPMLQCVAAGAVDIYNRKAGKKRALVKWWKISTGGRLRRARSS